MNHCNHCQAELVCEHVPPNRNYLCPSCGAPNFFGALGSGATISKFSRRSLFCGSAAALVVVLVVVLLFLELPIQAGVGGPVLVLLGVLAIYYAILSLMRSRYQPSGKWSKVEAWAGTLIGGSAGVLLGGIITTALIAGIIIQWFTEETQDISRVTTALNSTAKIDLPESVTWIPSLAKKTAIQKRIELWDDEKFVDSRNRFYLVWTNSVYTTQWGSSEINRQNLRQDALQFISGNQTRRAEGIHREKLFWHILDQSQEVAKIHWKGKIKNQNKEAVDAEFVTYHCLFDANHNTYCLTFFSKLPDPTVSESEIKATFESFKPIGSGW